MKTTKNIFMAFILNLSFSLIELFGGLITGSIAIFSDSFHDLGDALSIGLSYVLEKKSLKKPNYKYTYGYLRYSVLGSLIMTFILLTGSIFVIISAIKRIINPVEINYNGVLILAIFGIIINLLAVFYTKNSSSLNEKSVNLHMLEDVLGWLVVFVGSILMKITNLAIIDPILSLIVAIFILYEALKNLKLIVDIFLEKTPNGIDIEKIKKELLAIPLVIDVHHIHIRSMDGENNYATLHVVTKKYNPEVKEKVRKCLAKFNINHSTIEIEEAHELCLANECQIKNK